MEFQTENGLKEALSFLEKGDPVNAQIIISQLFEKELECPELMYSTLCCTFWDPVIKNLRYVDDPYERGDNLLTEWKSFLVYISKRKDEYKPALFATQTGIFRLALKNYSELLETVPLTQKPGLFLKAGKCYKKLGAYEDAAHCLTEANNLLPGQADVLAELADCYSLCGDDRSAKVLFREAFFVAPDKIDLDFLDSGLIRSLIDKLECKKYSKRALPEWIPIYGILWGIFNVKRELSSQEVGKLKQDIYAMENENKNPAADSEILVPRLLKSYFWLIDQYVMKNDSTAQINDVLLRIKILDSGIYDQYVK